MTTTAVGTSTSPIQGAELNRPSSPSTSGIDQALVLRNSRAPQPTRSRASYGETSGSPRASFSTLGWATRDSGFIASVIREKKNFSRLWPRKFRAVDASTSPVTRSGCRCHSSWATAPPIE